MPFGIDDAIIAAAVGSAISGGSGLLGGMFGRSGQEAANQQSMQFNSYQSQLNREWQEHMASTGYVRAMTDMRNAGLNPILAASLGPSIGGGGSAASATLGNAGAFMQQGVSSAGQAVRQGIESFESINRSRKDITQSDLNKGTLDFTKAQEQKAVQDTATSKAAERQADATTENLNSVTRNNIINSSILSHGVNTAKEEAELRRLAREAAQNAGVGKMGQDITTIERVIRRALDATRGGSSSSSPSPSPSRGPTGNTVLDSPVPSSNILGRPHRGN